MITGRVLSRIYEITDIYSDYLHCIQSAEVIYAKKSVRSRWLKTPIAKYIFPSARVSS
jgi:hypothetical protein